MGLTVKTQKHIWGLFAGRCAMCKELLIEDDDSIGRSLVGEVAHKAGERPDAARYDASMTDEERNDPENLMLLCRKHHKIIDDNELIYTLEKLSTIRADYLSWLAQQLAGATPWKLKVSAFAYLNVPRLVEYATMQGYRIRSPDLAPNTILHNLGFELGRVMEDFRRPLESMTISSIGVDQINFAHEDYVGQVVNFDRLRFRTKNLPAGIPRPGTVTSFAGDLATDPHIYHRFKKWTLVLNVDPRWITTTTAFTLFRPQSGSSVFTGFGRIHSVDLENMRMTATALAIGVPQSAFDMIMSNPSVRHVDLSGDTLPDAVDFKSLEDEVTRSRGGLWHGELPNCDFCGRPFAGEEYMVDGPMHPDGPWGCMCATCYSKSRLPLGIGKGQLYRWYRKKWRMVGGYPAPLSDDGE
jgi:hypothetical protein